MTKSLVDRLRTERSVYDAELASEAADRIEQLEDAAEMLWVVLTNVSGGDWGKQNQDWQEAAAKWRDNYFSVISGPQD